MKLIPIALLVLGLPNVTKAWNIEEPLKDGCFMGAIKTKVIIHRVDNPGEEFYSSTISMCMSIISRPGVLQKYNETQGIAAKRVFGCTLGVFGILTTWGKVGENIARDSSTTQGLVKECVRGLKEGSI